jgi:adenine/guanine phosphoribosyltransferase-like PRPP-binding protein
VFDPSTFPLIVDWIVSIVQEEKYEALAGSGHSGLLPMAAACYRLGLPMLAVRKYDERPKGSTGRVNGVLPHRPIRYALVDDFVASGETVERVDNEMSKAFPQATFAGLILFRTRPDCVESTRSDCARALGTERAAELTIHGRYTLRP